MARRGWIAALLGVVAVGAIAVAVTAYAGAGAAPPTTASPAADYGMGLLTRAQNAADAPAADLNPASIGHGGVARTSVRVLQSGTAGSYWVGLDAAGRLCLIGTAPNGTGAPRSACTTADRFGGHALVLSAASHAGPGATAEAYLFPDAVSAKLLSRALPEGATMSGYGNLILLDPAASAAARQSLARATSAVYDLGILAAPAG